MKLVGLAGWSDSGKTRLACALIKNISARGLSVSTIKHAHHSFDIDHPKKDSYRHRLAGAKEVVIASDKRWALMHEHGSDEHPLSLFSLVAKIEKVDVLLVEGFKKLPIDKLEIYRTSLQKSLLAPNDSRIKAIISDTAIAERVSIPTFDADNIVEITDFILDKSFFTYPTKGKTSLPHSQET